MNTDEINFHKSLSVLATACRFSLTEDAIRVYDLALSRIGYKNAEKAVVHAFMIRKSNDPMPSVMDLIRYASGRTSDEAMASEVSDKIWDAVARFGLYSEKLAKEFVGPIGCKVIERVGWSWLCGCELKEAAAVKAQLRGTAKSILESDRFEVINSLIGGEDGKVRIGNQSGNQSVPKQITEDVCQNDSSREDSRTKELVKGCFGPDRSL